MLICGVCSAHGSCVNSAQESCVARSVKFQPGLDGVYHKRIRIKIGPSACIDCRRENSQTFLWGLPDTGPLARDFLWKRDTRGEPSRFQGERGDHMEESIFQPYLGTRTIFKMDREILRPSYLPEKLPHRESHIGQLAQI